MISSIRTLFFFFFNDTATTEIYTLSLHDALPICSSVSLTSATMRARYRESVRDAKLVPAGATEEYVFDNFTFFSRRIAEGRSEEHTSELQSRLHLVCRLLLEKKKIDATRLMSAVH